MRYNVEQLSILIKALGDKLHHPEYKENPKNHMVTRMEKELESVKLLDGKNQTQPLEKLSNLVENFLVNLKGKGDTIKKECEKALKIASSPPSKPLPVPPKWASEPVARKRADAIRHTETTKPSRG